MSAENNQIINPEALARIQFTREQFVASFIEVQEAPKALVEKLAGP
jgi:hypothetical protein